MRRKEDWEKREIKTASLSIKRTQSLALEKELRYSRGILGLCGYTELNKEFLLMKCSQTEKEFEDDIYKLISKKTKIEKGKYAEEFRLFLAKKILKNCRTKEQKERWENYIENEEYK